jgi:hypothetical protein
MRMPWSAAKGRNSDTLTLRHKTHEISRNGNIYCQNISAVKAALEYGNGGKTQTTLLMCLSMSLDLSLLVCWLGARKSTIEDEELEKLEELFHFFSSPLSAENLQ